MIEAQLPPDWRDLAQQHGLDPTVVPPQLGAKVKDISVPLRLVLYHVGTNTSLKITTAMAAAAGLIDMSAVALHKWMRRFAPFLTALLVALTNAAKRFAAACWAGYDIIIVDASSVARPGSAGTTGRVHYALRLSNLQPVQIDVTDDKGGETFRRFAVMAQPGQLWLGDRGYANPPGIAAMKAQGADIMVRYNRGSLPLYDRDGRLLDVLRQKLVRLRQPGVPREWAAWVHPQGCEPIRGRLCAVRLPPDKADEARVRLRREQGTEVTAESLAMAEFVVVFTTVPRDRLSTALVLELYCLRWQVELTIKRDKSIAGLDQLPNFREDTIRSWLLAKMLLTQIARKIVTANVAIPPCAAECFSGDCGRAVPRTGTEWPSALPIWREARP
jgi:hypothetical protein